MSTKIIISLLLGTNFLSTFSFSAISQANATNLNKQVSNTAEVYNKQEQIYSQSINYEQEVIKYNQDLKSNPNDPKLYYKRAYAYYELQQYDKAIADLNKAIET